MQSLLQRFALVLTALCSLPLAAAEFYVAPNGNDQNPGTRERPFATLTQARDAVRRAKQGATAPLTVFLRGGSYYLDEPLVFTADDSGTPAAPIVYAAYQDETAVVSGGRRLYLQWRPYKNGILQADVPGVKEGHLAFDQLFVNGKRQVLARYPNYQPEALFNGTAADCLSPERVKRWAHPTTGFVHGQHAAGWGGVHYRIEGVDANGQVKLSRESGNNRRMGMNGNCRFVENIFEELDAPDEWFLNRTTGILYFMPPAGLGDMSAARVEVASLRHIVNFRGDAKHPVRCITLRGLTFTHAARTFMDTTEPLLRGDWCICREGAVLLTGAEDCAVRDCFFDAVGGNAVFINKYARRVEVTGCKITEAGASGVCLVGDPQAVRSPLSEAGQGGWWNKTDHAPGPKTVDYPAQCRVADNLMFDLGRVEKQVAGVCISMAEEITVSHNSIYHVPRAGININDGTWGGHVIEFNDVFDTVRETSDHGSFNSWGRDRYWHPNRDEIYKNLVATPGAELLDAWKTTTIRNNRWRCDHGWDIDLDDGSTNYHIYNNLCLHGGLKLREGMHRTAENNVLVGGGFHPHVWLNASGDTFTHNILANSGYNPIGMPPIWGKLVDFDLLRDAATLAASRAQGLDKHSMAGDPRFVDAAHGDYRVKDDSPALQVGFQNFPMDQFGVQRPALRAEARTPPLPGATNAGGPTTTRDETLQAWRGTSIKNLAGMGEMSATGMGSERGVLVVEVKAGSPLAAAGLRKMDVLLGVNGKSTDTAAEFLRACKAAGPGRLRLTLYRNQQRIEATIPGL